MFLFTFPVTSLARVFSSQLSYVIGVVTVVFECIMSAMFIVKFKIQSKKDAAAACHCG